MSLSSVIEKIVEKKGTKLEKRLDGLKKILEDISKKLDKILDVLIRICEGECR